MFREYSCCGDPTLTQRVERGELPPPPGFQENTTAAGLSFRGSFDTRAPDVNRSGIRVGVAVAPSVDVTRGFDRSWIQYGAGIEGSWDVNGRGRILSLGVLAQFADPLGSQPVPFTELVTVGGAEPFVGFLRGRLRDRSAIGAQLSWRWPVFAYIDGVAGVSFGNVFDAHLQNFRWDLLRLSAELGSPHRGHPRREQLPVRHRHRHRALQPGASPDLVQPRVRGDLCALGKRTRRSPSTQASEASQAATTSEGKCTPRYRRDPLTARTSSAEPASTGQRAGVRQARIVSTVPRAIELIAWPLGKPNHICCVAEFQSAGRSRP